VANFLPHTLSPAAFSSREGAVGYVPQGGFADVVMIALYDGAGTGIRVPDNIVTPAKSIKMESNNRWGKKFFFKYRLFMTEIHRRSINSHAEVPICN
jgi:hypothetical protein